MHISRLVVLAFVLHAAMLSTVQAQCSGCYNKTSVKDWLFPGITEGSHDLPNHQDPRWFIDPQDPQDPSDDILYFAPSEFPVEFTANVEGGGGSGGGQGGGGGGVNISPSNFELLKVTHFSVIRTPGVCAGSYPVCSETQGCQTGFEFQVELVGLPRTASWVTIIANDEQQVEKLRMTSEEDPVAISVVDTAACNGKNQETKLELDIANQWTNPDMMSTEWRCVSCPGPNL